ncbi:MAG: IS21 family transposase, partial [Desulfovibrionaceae bacterium]|nr:IS21 family transposase [Desulfovibrionaceae bacterium]
GVSQREAARRLGISRNTVAKYWDGGHIPGPPEERAGRAEARGKTAIKEAMRDYCEKNKGNEQRKHKINAKTIWRDLHYEYPRSEATYRRYFAELRGERQVNTRMPLSFGIGEAAEVDWKQATARYRGMEIKLHVLCVNLMYAYTPFKKAYLNEKQCNLVDGLASAIGFYHGAPRKFIMDNVVAARKVGYGKHAVLTDEFKLFAAHYGVEFVFNTPREPAEKGGVEVAAKTAGGILTPVMDIASIHEVNDKLLTECVHYINHTGRVGNRRGAVKEMTEEERPFLIPPPAKNYEVGIHGKARVSNQQLFEFDSHLYSAPRPYAGKEIGIIAYAFRIELYYHGRRVWECERPILDGENRVFPEHYRYDLDIKPRSRENAYPLLEGVMPPELDMFRNLCRPKNTKCYQLYMLMRLMDEVGREALLAAVGIANREGDPTYGKVLEILAPGRGGGEAGENACADDFYVEERDPSGYAALLGDGERGI